MQDVQAKERSSLYVCSSSPSVSSAPSSWLRCRGAGEAAASDDKRGREGEVGEAAHVASVLNEGLVYVVELVLVCDYGIK